jgi:PAS domain S-box-containing protein
MIINVANNGITKELNSLAGSFSFTTVASANEAIAQNLLSKAGIFIVGTDIEKPVSEIQKVYAADKHLSVILLAHPAAVRQIKQAIQFAPFIGSNTLVVTLTPELDLETVCKNAITRTQQKRSFDKIKMGAQSIASSFDKIKLAQMGAFLEFAPIGAILLNDLDRVVNYNKQAKLLFPALEFLNAELSQIFLREEVEQLKTIIHTEHHAETRHEIALRQKVLEVTCTQIFNEEGLRHVLLMFNDITNVRNETRRIQSILEALPQMAWATDAEGAVTYFTQGWYFYTGQSKAAALGEGWAEVIFADDREQIVEQWKASVRTGKAFQQAARFRNAEGSYRWHLARGSAIRNDAGEIYMWVGTCTDIHDQVMLTDELEKKVKERTHSLEQSNSELEQFAHISSHDLQEPLRKIRTFTGMLHDNVYELVDEASRRYIDKIAATAERMSASLTALLNFTSIHNEEKSTVVDLNNVAALVLVDLELMIQQKNAVIQVGNLPAIKAIPIQMQQLFYNLLNNALKFSRKDVAPQIVLSSKQLMEEELVQFPQLHRYKTYYEIVFKDNGIGFDQVYADKIFTIFQRLHSKSDYEGTGIGLSLVKKVVANHGGQVSVHSKQGHGTTFRVILESGE